MAEAKPSWLSSLWSGLQAGITAAIPTIAHSWMNTLLMPPGTQPTATQPTTNAQPITITMPPTAEPAIPSWVFIAGGGLVVFILLIVLITSIGGRK